MSKTSRRGWHMIISVSLISHLHTYTMQPFAQCDQMARLFFIFWRIYINENLPNDLQNLFKLG